MAEQNVVVDAGRCRDCGCVQSDHRQGKKGCTDPDCGCAKYLPPKDAPAAESAPAQPEADPASREPARPGDVYPVALPAAEGALANVIAGQRRELLARMTRESIELGTYDLVVPAAGPTCAYPAGEDDGEHDHALCEDVVTERTEAAVGPADLARAVAVAEALAAERDEARRERDMLRSRLDIIRQERRREHLAHQVLTLTAERDEARTGADELTATVARLRDELDRANAARQRAQDALDEAVHNGAAAASVLGRYDAWLCEACGSRYSKRLDHECGYEAGGLAPLTPVTVLIVRRQPTEDPAPAGLDTNRHAGTEVAR